MHELRTAKLREPAWRVHQNPTALPNLPAADENPLNRFDDPRKGYRVRYVATNKRGAFLEVFSRFRIDPSTQARLGAVKGVDEKSEPRLSPGAVPKKFLRALNEATVQITDTKHDFVDLTAPETLGLLNKNLLLRPLLSGAPLDEKTIRLGGPRGRPLTQAISRLVYDGTDAVGIRYISRLDPDEPCWAIFDWVEVKFSKVLPVDAQDPALAAAAVSLGLTLP